MLRLVTPVPPLFSLVFSCYPCYSLLPFVPLVTLLFYCYPLLLLVSPVTPCFPHYFLLPLVNPVTLCSRSLPELPLGTPFSPCYPGYPFLYPCFPRYPCYPLLPFLPFVTFVTSCYLANPLFPVFPFFTPVSPFTRWVALLPLAVPPCYPCYRLFSFVSPCYLLLLLLPLLSPFNPCYPCFHLFPLVFSVTPVFALLFWFPYVFVSPYFFLSPLWSLFLRSPLLAMFHVFPCYLFSVFPPVSSVPFLSLFLLFRSSPVFPSRCSSCSLNSPVFFCSTCPLFPCVLLFPLWVRLPVLNFPLPLVKLVFRSARAVVTAIAFFGEPFCNTRPFQWRLMCALLLRKPFPVRINFCLQWPLLYITEPFLVLTF